MRPVAASLPKIAAKAIGKRGFAEAALITEWGTIVGKELAQVSQPEKLAFSPGERNNGTLHIRVQGGVATELQHLEPLVIERINSHFGYSAVARLKLIHAPIRRPQSRYRDRKPAAAPASPEQRTALDTVLDTVDDPEVRAALYRLGNAVLGHQSEIEKS